ncbi:hypothetical protein B0H19DRAFT_1369405 [Mycena capillaripes]|nr:hypothetical protein B0H19DRAFT_1369405 [Mycena capillaripes]
MVVTRKTPVAPVPTGSRTNSSQPLPRAAKPKTTSSLADSEKEAAQAAAAAAKSVTTSPNSKTHPKSRHKNRHHKKPKPSGGWIDRLVYLSLSLLALYAFTTCPHDPNLSNPVCRGLAQYRVHILEPYVLPPIYRALEHPVVAPYVEKAQYIERTAIRPVIQKSAPYAAAAKRAVWDRALVPAFTAYVTPQYHKHVVPQWRKHVVPRWRKHAAPHIARAAPYARRAQHTLERTAHVLHKTYTTRVAPAASHAYAVGKPYVVRSYRAARPHVISLYVLGAEKAGAARRAYVDPHVVRIWEKVLELSGAGPVGSPTEQHTPVPEQEPTAASSEDATTEAVVSETAVEAVVTPVKASSSSAAPSAEEEVPAPMATPSEASSASSVVKASSASSVVPPPPVVAESSSSSVAPPETTPAAAEPEAKDAVLEELSAASIAIQSAHGMESPVVEEILADVQATINEPASTLSASASTSVPTEAEVEPVLEEEDEDDLTDFLGDLGLVSDPSQDDVYGGIEPDKDEDIELSRIEIERLKYRQQEEQAAAKERHTKEERARIMGLMAESREQLHALVKEKNKALRKMLVGTRKAAVSRLDDPRTEAGGAVRGVKKEGDKLLAGLEGYLRKELKANKAGGADMAERAEKWETVVQKVEERLQGSVHAAQGVLQAFHAEEKAQEVEGGMEIIQEVKDACGQAQGNVGLDLSWLDDVSPMDWQDYHDLMRIGNDFQAEVSAIQAGTHAHPPVDPFLKRLEERQAALSELVDELVGKIHRLREQAERTFAPQVEEPVEEVVEEVVEEAPVEDTPVEEEVAEEESEAAEPEPEVSILPVPPSAEPGVVDPAQVVIGKSTEQVKQAMRDAGEL